MKINCQKSSHHHFYSESKEGSCPSSFPYAYAERLYCCKTNKEKIGTTHGTRCDGGIIGIKSLCCENDDYMKCEFQRCYNHEDATDEYGVDDP